MKKNMNENFEITVDEMTEIFGDTPVEMSFREVKEGMDSFFGLMGLTVELVNLIRKEDELKKHHRAYLHTKTSISSTTSPRGWMRCPALSLSISWQSWIAAAMK